MKRSAPRSIDEYIAGFPADVQQKLKRIRSTIRKAAPRAEETISYQIPTFVLNGHLIFFAGFKDHISVYPAPRGSADFQEELAAYKGGKGTVQFPLDRPVPLDLIRRIVEFRIRANAEAARAKQAKAAAKGKPGAKKTRPRKKAAGKAREPKRS
jgi:uncharacterized protein YdhG (YjbR/CyaY superfamily)